MHRTIALAAAALLAGGSLAALAAAPEPNPMDASISGTVAHYTLAPKGEVDGFVLGDGTQVHVPPHQAAALVFTARPGDTVSVQGRRAEGGSVIEAGLIRNQTSGVALENIGPRHERDGAGSGQVSGKVQFLLHGPKGEANGAILEDGTVLRLSPTEAKQLAPGRSLMAEGPILVTPMGRLVDVKKLDSGPGA